MKKKTLQELTIMDGFLFGEVMQDPETCRLHSWMKEEKAGKKGLKKVCGKAGYCKQSPFIAKRCIWMIKRSRINFNPASSYQQMKRRDILHNRSEMDRSVS